MKFYVIMGQAKVVQNVESCRLQPGSTIRLKITHLNLIPNEADPQFAEMVPPFTPVDREADYRQAWGYFEGKVGERLSPS